MLKSELYIKEIQNIENEEMDEDTYPYNIPSIKALTKLRFTSPVTIFVGENGIGKSTLMEAIAIKSGFNAEGGSKNFNFATNETHSNLYEHIKIIRSYNHAKDGYFLRAESFYNVATELEKLAIPLRNYGGKGLHKQSHGESFLSLLRYRLSGNGLYLFDEPEAALSPSSQLAMLCRINDLVKQNSQFIIATHSPILMSFPNATIYQITENGFESINYKETEHFSLTKLFLNNPEMMLQRLFNGD